MGTTRKLAVMVASVALTTTACGKSSPDSALAERHAIEARISSLAQAERENNAAMFLAGVTDQGLESFGEGTRVEIEAGQGSFGQQPPGPVTFVSTVVAVTRRGPWPTSTIVTESPA